MNILLLTIGTRKKERGIVDDDDGAKNTEGSQTLTGGMVGFGSWKLGDSSHLGH